jgi:hypothetical protein
MKTPGQAHGVAPLGGSGGGEEEEEEEERGKAGVPKLHVRVMRWRAVGRGTLSAVYELISAVTVDVPHALHSW